MTYPNSLSGLRVAVTGGTSGLGLALVRQFSGAGADVAFTARTAAAVERTAMATGAHGIVGDIAAKTDIYLTALQVLGVLGGLDVLVNNASTLGPVPLSLLSDTDCEALESALGVNVVGPFRLTKAVYGALAGSARQGRKPLVINIVSDAAVSAYPTWGAYGTSKAALLHMTRIWAEEAKGDGVDFVALDPGDMDTPMHALADPEADPSALKRPEDSAAEILSLVRDRLPAIGTARVGETA